jgi:hypothetical protein
LRGVEAAGEIVSSCELISSESNVAPVSGSTGFPHKAQNLLFSETWEPHDEQYMGGRDSITGLQLSATSWNGN